MPTLILAMLFVWPFASAPTPTPAPSPDPVVTLSPDSRREFCRKIFTTIDGTCEAPMQELGGCAKFRREFCEPKKGGKP